MPRRSSKWVLHEKQDKNTNQTTWDLSRGGRYLYEGLRSKPEALMRLKNHYRPGEPVIHEAPDGYRTNITESLKKGKVISG